MNIRSQIFGVTPSAQSPLVTAKRPRGASGDALLSIPVERREQRWAEGRACLREPMFPEPAQATWKGAAHPVQLVSVSAGGASIEADFQATLWDRLALDMDGRGTAECTVVWMNRERLGLEFAETSAQ